MVVHITPILDFIFTVRPITVNLGPTTHHHLHMLQSSVSKGMDMHAIVEDLIEDSMQVAEKYVGPPLLVYLLSMSCNP